MVVQHNITAMNANRYFGINNKKLSKSLEKLSSGYAINRAGDNAAGLAVSEKMRSQIAGMTQAVKNAQDGISMVQTYEGALTETDSILQRMKTLATQIANGGYDDPVDRTAAQQEFYQLNDELDQIADTDYNGVVVLNGGKMADGAVADKNGLIDYANQIPVPGQLGTSDINTLDNTKINKEAVDEAWSEWSNGKGAYDRSDKTKPQGPDSIDIEFTYDGKGGWKVTGCSDAGMDLSKIQDGLTKGTSAAQNNGGFELQTKGTDGKVLANVVVDTSELVEGDTIKLTIENPNVSNSASENFAVATDGINDKTKGLKGAAGAQTSVDSSGVDLSAIKWTLKTGTGGIESTYQAGNDKDMSEETKALLDALNGAEISVEYDSTGTGAVADGKINIKLKGEALAQSVAVKGTDLVVGGKVVGKAEMTASTTTAGAKLKISDINGNEIGTFDFVASPAAAADATAVTGTVTYTIANSESTYSDANKPSVKVKEPDDYSVSKSNAFKHSEAKMTYKDHLILQVGARTKDAVDFTFQYDSDAIGDLVADLNCTAKGLGTDILDIKTQESANYAVDKIDQALNKVSLVRGTFGAIQNRLDHKIDNLNVTVENLTDAESRIRDTNMAEEMMNFTKNQILSQASQSMLAQANQLPQSVLQLLQ